MLIFEVCVLHIYMYINLTINTINTIFKMPIKRKQYEKSVCDVVLTLQMYNILNMHSAESILCC